MRGVLPLMITILPLCAPATFASEIEFEEGLNSLAVGGPGFSDLSTLIDLFGQPTPLFYAQRTIALKLTNFHKIERIKQTNKRKDYPGGTI